MPFDTVVAPHVNVNDVEVLVAEWRVKAWQAVEKGTLLCLVETTKTVLEVTSPAKGFAFPVVAAGSSVRVGEPLAHLFPTSDLAQLAELRPSDVKSTITITKKARELMDKHGLTEADFAAFSTVSSDTVIAKLRDAQQTPDRNRAQTAGAELMPDENSVALFGDPNQALLSLDALEAGSTLKAFALFDDHYSQPTFHGLPVLTRDALAPLAKRGLRKAYFCLTAASATEAAAEEAARLGVDTISIIHPSASVSARSKLGKGVFVGALAAIGPEVSIGDFARILSGASVAHHSRVGRHTSISDGAHLGGNVEVGDGALVGIGANLNKRVTVGSRAIVVSGATVTDNVPDGYVARLDGTSAPLPRS